jgi:hypothetical protein
VLFPVFLLTDLGAVHDGLASTAVRERDTFWCNDVAEATDLGHDCAWSVYCIENEIPWRNVSRIFFDLRLGGHFVSHK